MNFINFIEHVVAHGANNKYYYRVHPKGDIYNVIRNGLWSYSPNQFPHSGHDESWPDESKSYRFYVAKKQWNMHMSDRFRIRIPVSKIENRLEKDHFGDYYIDTGNDSELIVNPTEFDIDLGGNQWIRADHAQPLIAKIWHNMYYKPPGFYRTDDENDFDYTS